MPGGELLQGFPSMAQQTSACSATANLLSQTAPVLVLIQCQMRMLNLLQPLITIIGALPNPPAMALQGFAKAAADLSPCLMTTTSVGFIPFLRDLLCLEIQSLKCFLQNLGSARKRSDEGVKDVLSSYAPMIGVLKLADSFYQMVGVQIPTPPVLSSKTDKVSLDSNVQAVKDFVATLQVVTDSLGGCSS
jgi:hypothetical protein